MRRVLDGGVPFELRRSTAVARKAKAPRVANPFLPPDPDLLVAELGAHRVVLNKFPVFPDHLLLVTRVYEPQDSPLGVADFAALLAGMAAGPALGFYNSGPRSGASQPHRHLQLVRLDVGAFALLPELGRAPFVALDAPLSPDPATAWAAYDALLTRIGRETPYNLLAAADRLWMVPRRAESAEGVSVNALGFAGSLFAASGEALARLEASGPLRVLTGVGVPR